ncbi:hypothetical protein [Novipirellula rosea]
MPLIVSHAIQCKQQQLSEFSVEVLRLQASEMASMRGGEIKSTTRLATAA